VLLEYFLKKKNIESQKVTDLEAEIKNKIDNAYKEMYKCINNVDLSTISGFLKELKNNIENEINFKNIYIALINYVRNDLWNDMEKQESNGRHK